MSQYLFKHDLGSIIWDSLVSNDSEELIFDLRSVDGSNAEYKKLNLSDFSWENIEGEKISSWSKMEAYEGSLYLCTYNDQADPTNKDYFAISEGKVKKVDLTEIPYREPDFTLPNIYEQNSEYYLTVCEFLGLDLACSCEYLETGKKIIISYYLRSDNDLKRYLLVLNDGQEELKVLQDDRMAGFASGSFFVLENKLIFIKNRNEVCIYPV